MADQVTGDDRSPETIEREMLQTRESLTEKVAALESQVVGTVQTAADTLTDTVEAVKSFVQTAPEAVSETVKQASSAVSEAFRNTLDVSTHVRANPWAAVGISAAVGAVVGYVTASGRRGLMEGLSESTASATAPARPVAGAAPARAGMFDELFAMLGGKLREVAEAALTAASTSLKAAVETRVPHLVDGAATLVADRLQDRAPDTIAGRFEARGSRGS